jgi:hypothetical protein
MFGFGKKQPQSAPAFVVGSSSLFTKNRLTPSEFGREATRLGFSFALAQFQQYKNADDLSVLDIRLLKEVACNPGIMQLLYANLITGGFLCHAKMILHVNESVASEIEDGVLTELRATMPGIGDEILVSHKTITANFAIAIEREIRNIEPDSTISLMHNYITHFYPEALLAGRSELPSSLRSFIIGLGSRFVAVCQGDFKISLQQA